MFTKIGKNIITLFLVTALVAFVPAALGRGGGGRGGSGGGSFRGGGFRGGSMGHIGGGSSLRGGGIRSGTIGVTSRGGGGLNRGAAIRSGGGFDSRGRGGRGGGGLVVSGRRGGDIRPLGASSGRFRSGGRGGGHFNRSNIFDNTFAFRRGFFNRGILDGRARFQRNDFVLDARRGDFTFVRREAFSPFFHNRHFLHHSPFFHRRFFFNPFFGGSVIFVGAPYYYPYYDYGYYPRPYDSGGDTYNYYYYNTPDKTGVTYGTLPADKSGYQKRERPATPTEADTYFDAGITAFAKEDYATAMQKFAAAKAIAPQDKVLPFAYAQAVFAMGNYSAAAVAIREAISKVNPETEGVFYPRGLYTDEAVLTRQIAILDEAAAKDAKNANLQLMLGYHRLGMGDLDKAEAALKGAATDEKNGPAANALLKMIEKLRAAEAEAAKAQQAPKEEAPKTESPKAESP